MTIRSNTEDFMTTTVIIPTTGSPEVKQAIESVINQSHPTTCYVVVDGEKFYDRSKEILKSFDPNIVKVCYLPLNVGANGFYGHRVYAAFTHLINTKYVLYLDQDNWLEPNHVEECVKTIESENLDWCYSLRNIYNKDSKFVCQDNCESLGKWNTFEGRDHIDTNVYCLKSEIAIRLSSVWHGGWGQDRVFYSAIKQHFTKYNCSGKYTVNYRVDGGEGSVKSDFFIYGNKIMNDLYNGNFPWKKS